MTRLPQTRKKRGIILLMTLFFMILFALLSFALYQLSPNENRTALRDRTLTEAHFACTAGIRNIKEWISAVTKPDSNTGSINYLGDTWVGGNVSAGSVSYPRLHNDPFSVPPGDPNFTQTSLGALTCPYGRFSAKTGVDFLGLQPDQNLIGVDYNALKAAQGNWLALKSSNPLMVGDYAVHTFVVPSANTMQMAVGAIPSGLRTYLVTCVAYRDGLPVMRARCLLKEKSAADYAYRTNVGGKDVRGNPIAFNIVDKDTVLFDGPVHTNEVPYISVPTSYWDSALSYYASDTFRTRPKRAFMGSLTFSGTDSNLSPAFDGVGYAGGNNPTYPGGGTAITQRPYDNSGNPIASASQGANPVPSTGAIVNRYDRLIEGGRNSISRVSTVPLPQNLTTLQTGAFGNQSDTGLDPNLSQVAPTQVNGSLQNPTVTIPSYRNSSGVLVAGSTKTNTSDFGIFVNPKAGTTEVAGGVVVKGDVRNMFLEVQDANGKIVTDASGLAAGTVPGNPVVRVQSTVTSYDYNSGTDVQNYANNPVYTPPSWIATGADTWVATINGTPGHTVAGTAGHTVPGTPGHTVAGTPGHTVGAGGTLHSAASCPSPVYTPPAGGGAGTGTYSCPHINPGTWVAATPDTWAAGTPDTWVAGTSDTWVAGTATVAGHTVAGAPGHTQAGFTSNNWQPAGTVRIPGATYKAQDWVVDVKNVATTIQPSIPVPAGADANAWAFGVGTQMTTADSNRAHNADLPGNNGDGGITEVYLHSAANDVAGTKVTAAVPVTTGKVLVYKQSRSDANRVDVFMLDRPSNLTPAQQAGGLNGAIYGTGDITGLRGVNMEAKTIGVSYGDGVNPNTQKGISIVDNVWQYGTAKGNKPTSANNGLGLVAPKMQVSTREGQFLDKQLYIYATIIAGSSTQTGSGSWTSTGATGNPYGGLDVSNANLVDTTDWSRVANSTNSFASRRTIQIFGGLTEQQTKARLDGNAGWSQQFNFDKELSLKPPPFFPSSNLLIPLAYTQESVLGK
ncbi:hypothetical protein JST97_18060 [bacterium]|nr:hypothetical protein [bacterium]